MISNSAEEFSQVCQPSYPVQPKVFIVVRRSACYISFDLQTPIPIRESAKSERLSRLNHSLSRLQLDCEEMLDMVLSVCDSEHHLTKRAVNVCRQLRRMRGDLDRSVSQSAIHRIK